jgi:ubiquinone/menaquinone biosynthesis C-methylase UbiE
MDVFFDVHSDLPREGPGDSDSTRKAFSFLKDLPPQPDILDIGCGPGMQTIDLARLMPGHITAIDTHEPFLEALRQRVAAEGLTERITLRNMSMFNLEFEPHSFDIIWSEGAIYILGFETGLRVCKKLLKPGGYMAVTEISWIKPGIPEECRAYWELNYPGMKSVEENLELVRKQGYLDVGHFVLPESSWWTHYYTPIEERIVQLRQKYQDDAEALRQLDEHQLEIEIYRKYFAWYGYVFYVMQAV